MSSEDELDHDEYDDDEEEEEEDVEEDVPVAKKRRNKQGGKQKKKKDPNKPKRNMSAYFLYSNASRERVKKENPSASFGDLARIISEQFKSLSPEEKKVWEKKAEKDKQRYEKEMRQYVAPDDDSDDGGKKKKKSKKDPNAPKRNMSAFFLYSNAMRSAFKNANPDASFGDLARIISAAFKELPNHERQEWERKAEADKIRYQREVASYNAH